VLLTVDPGLSRGGPRLAAELREYAELLRLDRLLVPAVPQLDPRTTTGVPVLLIPGFMAGDRSLAPMRRYLRRRGHPTFPSGITVNAGCSDELLDRLEKRLRVSAARAGRPVAIVGQSRGGSLGKLLTLRCPELVAGLVTLGSPVLDQLAAAPLIRGHVELLAVLNRLGYRGVLSGDCLRGDCATRNSELLREPLPSHIPYTAVYSREDGIVDWHACLDPAAEQVEVQCGHIVMAIDADVRHIVADRIDSLRPPS
jgi:triacylglycerol lipase